MTRGYWIVRVDVRDAEAYKDYAAANGAAFAEFGGRFLVRGGRFEAVAGTARARNVVVEFASYDDALACWKSDGYQAARAKQKGGADAEILIIEGYDGAQPSVGIAPEPANPASECGRGPSRPRSAAGSAAGTRSSRPAPGRVRPGTG